MAVNLKRWFLSVLCCTGERCPHPTKVLRTGKIPRRLKKNYNFQFAMNINKQKINPAGGGCGSWSRDCSAKHCTCIISCNAPASPLRRSFWFQNFSPMLRFPLIVKSMLGKHFWWGLAFWNDSSILKFRFVPHWPTHLDKAIPSLAASISLSIKWRYCYPVDLSWASNKIMSGKVPWNRIWTSL